MTKHEISRLLNRRRVLLAALGVALLAGGGAFNEFDLQAPLRPPAMAFAGAFALVSLSGAVGLWLLSARLRKSRRQALFSLRRLLAASKRERRLRQDCAERSRELVTAEHLRAEASQALERSERKFRSLFENLAVGIGQVDPHTRRFVDANSRLMEILGYRLDELERKTITDITHPDDRHLDRRQFGRLVGGETKQYCLEKRLIRKDGSVIWVRINANLVATGREAAMVLGIVQDITAEKTAAAESLRAKEAAENATEAKSYFLANMSHEIRTPLGAVVGFSELIGDPQTTPQEREIFLAAIKRNSELLSNIIDDILDLSKIEAGKIHIDPHEVSPDNVIADIHWLLSRKAREKGIALTFTHGADVPKKIVTDPLRLKQILINIVGNAIKFTARGKVEVVTSMATAADGSPMVRVEVHDTGVGIPADQILKLFAPFSQADMTHKRKHGGTGLGLVLSKRLAELLGGDVALTRTEIDRGSTFTLEIAARLDLRRATIPPETPAHADPPVTDHARELEGVRVLLAEDSVDNQILVGRILELAGASVDIVSNGQEALEKAQHGGYDTLLMDLQMPIMDGYEATQELRRKGYRGKIVAFTAHAFNEDRVRCFQSGFDRHVSKPVNPHALITAISGLTDRHPPKSTPA